MNYTLTAGACDIRFIKDGTHYRATYFVDYNTSGPVRSTRQRIDSWLTSTAQGIWTIDSFCVLFTEAADALLFQLWIQRKS